MRLLVFFDLPVVKKEDRKEYQKFRKFLINDGYYMLQFSVYSRLCNNQETLDKHIKRLVKNLPKKGSVRYLQVTEKQYGAMKIVLGEKNKKEKYQKVEQLSVF
ncbi:CRISPR-associated endonuclease Cas2 [Clostridium thermarum]|uniref:CRISPR-associated endonuclease Cas2 n=1 Tax=Clostridium thermarum TaxID=1716543 RepID=UPI0013D65BE9|nr:CRISPR-associated endonuclease Cas2 [Clostridium thermarum]